MNTATKEAFLHIAHTLRGALLTGCVGPKAMLAALYGMETLVAFDDRPPTVEEQEERRRFYLGDSPPIEGETLEMLGAVERGEVRVRYPDGTMRP